MLRPATSRTRYQHFSRIPEGFSRQVPLCEVKAGDEILWTDDSPIAIVTWIALTGKPGQRGRSYRIESRTKDASPDAEPYSEVVGATTKLFIRPRQ